MSKKPAGPLRPWERPGFVARPVFALQMSGRTIGGDEKNADSMTHAEHEAQIQAIRRELRSCGINAQFRMVQQ